MIHTLSVKVELAFEDGYFCKFNALISRLESLIDLDSKLRKLDSRLILIRGSPQEIFPILLKKWNISSIYYERDTEPYPVERDSIVSELCQKLEVAVHSITGHTLFLPEDVIKANKGKAPLTLTSFLKVYLFIKN